MEKHEGVSLEKETVNSLDRESEEREWIEFDIIEDDMNCIEVKDWRMWNEVLVLVWRMKEDE